MQGAKRMLHIWNGACCIRSLFRKSWQPQLWSPRWHVTTQLSGFTPLNPKPRRFELQALEAAIEMGLPRVEAGAQGEHKIQRGYLPSLTHSSHYIRDPDFRGAVSHVRFTSCRSRLLLWHVTQHAHGADCRPCWALREAIGLSAVRSLHMIIDMTLA
jgi:Peptidogalycan biosysnthesis/recognition